MRDHGWYGEDRSIGEHDAPEFPVQYTVNFPWGEWYVSAAAHEDYGLVPLMPIEEGYAPQVWTQNSWPVRVYLLSTEELHETASSLAPGQTGITHAFKRDSVEVDIAVGGTAESITGLILDDTREAGADELRVSSKENLRDHIVTPDGITFGESLAQDMPQLIIHDVTDKLRDSLPGMLFSDFEVERYKSYFKIIRRGGALALTSVGMTAVAGILDHNAYWDAGGVAALGLIGAFTLRDVKRQLKWESYNTPWVLQHTKNWGHMVAEDIHNAYCRRHFESQHRNLIEPDE